MGCKEKHKTKIRKKKGLDCKRGLNLLVSIEERKKIWGGRRLWRKIKDFGEGGGWEKRKDIFICRGVAKNKYLGVVL